MENRVSNLEASSALSPFARRVFQTLERNSKLEQERLRQLVETPCSQEDQYKLNGKSRFNRDWFSNTERHKVTGNCLEKYSADLVSQQARIAAEYDEYPNSYYAQSQNISLGNRVVPVNTADQRPFSGYHSVSEESVSNPSLFKVHPVCNKPKQSSKRHTNAKPTEKSLMAPKDAKKSSSMRKMQASAVGQSANSATGQKTIQTKISEGFQKTKVINVDFSKWKFQKTGKSVTAISEPYNNCRTATPSLDFKSIQSDTTNIMRQTSVSTEFLSGTVSVDTLENAASVKAGNDQLSAVSVLASVETRDDEASNETLCVSALVETGENAAIGSVDALEPKFDSISLDLEDAFFEAVDKAENRLKIPETFPESMKPANTHSAGYCPVETRESNAVVGELPSFLVVKEKTECNDEIPVGQFKIRVEASVSQLIESNSDVNHSSEVLDVSGNKDILEELGDSDKENYRDVEAIDEKGGVIQKGTKKNDVTLFPLAILGRQKQSDELVNRKKAVLKRIEKYAFPLAETAETKRKSGEDTGLSQNPAVKRKKFQPPLKKTFESQISNSRETANEPAINVSNKANTMADNLGLTLKLPVQNAKERKTFKTKMSISKKSDKTVLESKNKAAQVKKKLVQSKLTLFKKSAAAITDNVSVFDLTDSSVADLVCQIQESAPTQVCMTLVYVGQLSQMEDPQNAAKVQGIMLRFLWTSELVEYFYVPHELFRGESRSNASELFHSLLKLTDTAVGIESAEVIMYLIHKLKYLRYDTEQWRLHDILLARWLLEPHEPVTTFSALLKLLQIDSNEALKQCDWQQKACKYLDLLSCAFEKLRKQLTEAHLWGLYVDLEVPLAPILARMSARGVHVDEEGLRGLGDTMAKKLNELEKEGNKLAGCPLLLTSAQQLRKVLYDQLQLDRKANLQVKGTASTGAKSTCETVLRQLTSVHPLPQIILQHRKIHKLNSTFVEGIIPFVKKDVVHCIWEQRSAATGRLACSNPNLQSISKQWVTIDEDRRERINVRSVFKPRDGHVFVLADFQHIELRMFAHLSQDPGLIQTFQSEEDVFVKLTSRWRGGDNVTAEDREKTKRIVYSVLYGAGPAKLAEYLEITVPAATALYNSFCSTFPVMKKFTRSLIEQCLSQQGRLVTIQGRARTFANLTDVSASTRSQAERQALNFLIQGSAADLCKRAMLLTERAITHAPIPVEAHLVLQIHDELVWEVPAHQADILKELVQKVMEDNTALNGDVTLSVPIRVRITQQESLALDDK